MNNNVALIVDTNSNYSDVWAPCFGRLAKYANTFKKYAFTDTPEGIPEDVTPIMYDNQNIVFVNLLKGQKLQPTLRVICT